MKLKPKFQRGQTVRLSNDAAENENYSRFAGLDLIIKTVSTSVKDHPGYDTGVGGGLYDLMIAETGADLPFSLYDWELTRVV